MRHFLRYSLVFIFSFLAFEMFGQSNVWQDIYTVKKKDTIYGIAQSYGITMDELMNANPEMKSDGYKLKKGATIFIPKSSQQLAQEKAEAEKAAKKMKTNPGQTIRVGIMLPIHDVDGDGKRMTEFYRGFLLGCDSLRKSGINTDIHTWNVNVDADINATLQDPDARNLDVIFGPLYTSQADALAEFCRGNDIKLVIPFSIKTSPETANPQVYKVFQDANTQNERSAGCFLERFSNAHPIIVNCGDTTNYRKTVFTSLLRKQLDACQIAYNITSVETPMAQFAKAFSASKQNVIVLNSAANSYLKEIKEKLDAIRKANPGILITLYGYQEWFQREKENLDLYYTYDTYIPTPYYYNRYQKRVAALESSYKNWFGTPMMDQYIYRFALSGYDYAQFFVRGLYEKGSDFKGTIKESTYRSMQTPLRFKDAAENGQGGMINSAFELIHFKTNRQIETIGY